ncbi:MAG: hypothetical protein M1823_000318 [Watsoniomyces obsoletus]|nr:MAG: hypothetical protein M1823_000318 [Watsoniomyces obsoletus]
MDTVPANHGPPARSNISNPIKRIRWATQRVPGPSGRRKRHQIMDRFHRKSSLHGKKRDSAGTNSEDGSTPIPPDVEGSEAGSDHPEAHRSIFFNQSLPDHAKDEHGRPRARFERNKVRTAKYTPLSFVPKNLWFQFQNIANVYFLFIIILSCFTIFGAQNAGLSAVPLIFILTVTAIKDAIEDYRRTVLDNELNNSPVHRLVGWTNVNSTEDRISPWRRLKKATSRGLQWLMDRWRARKRKNRGASNTLTDGAIDSRRGSMATRATPRTSVYSTRSERPSMDASDRRSPEHDIPMTEVNRTPARQLNPDNSTLQVNDRPVTAFSFEGDPSGLDGVAAAPRASRKSEVPAAARFYGSLIDPTKPAAGEARFTKDRWKNVQVGDFVRIYSDDQIPADIVVLSTSDPDGACYVETKNLDGETNLKVRQALHCGRKVKHASDCERTSFVIESEPPHANLYQYSAVVRWQQRDKNHPEAPTRDMAEPISIQNLLLRGCSLRNTEWILGVVVFTGPETKIMINSGITPSKRSRIARELNWNVIYNFIILFIMCLLSGIIQGVTWAQGNNSLNFFEFGSVAGSPPLDGFVTFWSAVILFQNLVPISLYITLEIIRTLQVFFIYSDVYMYYDKIDYPCTPKSWNLSDDLGQIEYIFSDKTGTLTQNVMEFKKCTINGVPYGEAYTEAQIGLQRRQGINVDEEGPKVRAQIEADRTRMIQMIREMHANPYLHDDELTFVAPDYITDLRGDSGDAQREANRHFMLALALCHTVISERTPGDPPKIEFKAQSPDEAALVGTARDCGFTFLGRNHDSLIVNVLGEEQHYQILNTLEFNSTRKRMSAIIRMPDGRILLFCKGADSVIYSRLRPGEQPELRQATAEHLETFAREGLRTLCVAQRELNEEEYRVWNKEHDLAAAAVQDREDRLEKVADIIERELTLLGGTAIEDRLQDGVPDTIALLADAGIKLWVLTGDKVETAINIGFACNLLSNDMELIVFKVEDETAEAAAEELEKRLSQFGITGSDEELVAARKNHEAPPPTHALVIDGDSLRLVLEGELRQKFLLLCKQCKSILCCRVSPSQKAAVVQMVKVGLDVMTLSIGDGANDVAMIQQADVGVGIAGEEGRQAVMSSDFAIGQFRFLQRLVLVHGRWSYRRLAETIANFFYKNIVWTFTLFWFQIHTNFDCTYLYEYTYILLVNIVFTSLPVILMGVLDQDVSDKISLAVPQLYRRGIERKEWTQTKFWLYMLDGIYQSIMCYFITYLAFAPAHMVTQSGHQVNDPPQMGVYVGCATIFIVNVYILLNTYRWDWLMVLIVTISWLLIWWWTGVYSSFESSNQFYKAAEHVYAQLSYWAIFLLTAIICLVPRFTAKAFQKMFRPYDVDIVREQVRQGKFKYLDHADPGAVPHHQASSKMASSTSSETSKPPNGPKHEAHVSEDQRPLYPPSVAATATTQDPRSQNGSDGTDPAGARDSFDRNPHPGFDHHRPGGFEHRPRPSYDRVRSSMDKMRPSFEAHNEITSAAMLTRMESSQCHSRTRRTEDITADMN